MGYSENTGVHFAGIVKKHEGKQDELLDYERLKWYTYTRKKLTSELAGKAFFSGFDRCELIEAPERKTACQMSK